MVEGTKRATVHRGELINFISKFRTESIEQEIDAWNIMRKKEFTEERADLSKIKFSKTKPQKHFREMIVDVENSLFSAFSKN